MLQTLKNYYHLLQAICANSWYRFPSRRLKVIGITGTDGKTTTTSVIYHILETAGKKTSMVSSVFAKIGGVEYDTGFHVTSPNPLDVQKYLRQSADNGDEYFVLETTSHGIDQNRVWGIAYEVGVVTNITHEHLDYHKTYENYVQVKSRLLQRAHTAIVNADDESYPLLKKILARNFITYAIHTKADYQMDLAQKLNIPIPEFNAYNYLAAYVVCRKLGIDESVIFDALKSFKLPKGRIDFISTHPVTAIVDFAHTPNSIDKILLYIKRKVLGPGGRIIHVFGSAAKRDVAKRPAMGRASGTHADLVILTEEDYRDEDPNEIADQIAAGLKEKNFERVRPEEFGSSNNQYTVIIDRAEAVKKAVSVAKPGDVLIFTGKGHEQSLCRGQKEYSWDDAVAVKKALDLGV